MTTNGLNSRVTTPVVWPSTMLSAPRPLRDALIVIVGFGFAIAFMEWALLAGNPPPHLWLLVLYGFVGLVAVFVGAWLWRLRPSNRMGFLLVLLGASVMASALGNIDNRVLALFASGLVGEAPIAAIAHVVLAFPSGRLPDRSSRAIVVASYGMSCLAQIPIFAFHPQSASYTWFHIAGHAALADQLHLVRSIVHSILLVLAAVLLSRRVRATKVLAERRVIALVYVYGIFALVSFPLTAQVLRRFLNWSVYALFGAQLLIALGVPLVIAAAILSGGLARTLELGELAAWLGSPESRGSSLRDALARALGDPSVQLLHQLDDLPQSLVDACGIPLERDALTTSRGVVSIDAPSGRAVIIYDSVLIADPEPVRAAGHVLALAIDHERITADLFVAQGELRESRLRILSNGDEQRRQLAQDLHDGLQGRLVGVGVHAARLAASLTLRDGSTELAASAAAMRDELDVAITQLRHLVHGVMPPLLIERGLFAAVEELADGQIVTVALHLSGPDGGLAWPVVSASYFIVAEALANSAKHAHASALSIGLTATSHTLLIEVGDDGIGNADLSGFGLRGMADRVATLGGTMAVHSPEGGGTMLRVALPCRATPKTAAKTPAVAVAVAVLATVS